MRAAASMGIDGIEVTVLGNLRINMSRHTQTVRLYRVDTRGVPYGHIEEYGRTRFIENLTKVRVTKEGT